jgi:hypothetical protein
LGSAARFPLKLPLEIDNREELVLQLGLFQRPAHHKRTAKQVAEAVALTMIDGWAFPSALKFVTCFTPFPKLDLSKLSDFKFNSKLFSPLAQMESARAYREPYLYLRDLKQNFDIEALDEAGWPGFFPLDDVSPGTRLADWKRYYSWSEHFWEDIPHDCFDESNDTESEITSGDAGDANEDETDAIEVENFVNNPDPEVAGRNRYLKQLPYITELASNFDAIARTSFAKEIISRQQRRLVLADTFYLPEDLDIAERGRAVLCSIHLGESDNVDKFDDLVFWDYHATLCIECSAGQWSPIAVLNGVLIEPYRSLYQVSENNFQFAMDAHSAMLNDVWKVLTFEFFAKSRYRNLSGYLQQRPASSFAVVSIEIHPNYRGKGLLPSLMEGFLSVFNGQPDSNVEHFWSMSGLERENWLAASDDLGEDELAIEVCPPSVLIFPVAGTPPEEIVAGPQNFRLVTSPAKLRNRKVDQNAESRRAKLESHFLSLRGRLIDPFDEQAIEILVYDPWGYPTT